MARPLRIEYPGAIYHITARGNEKKVIYKYDSDYVAFLTYLIEAVPAFRLRLFAYILMPNHFHLLLQTLDANLSRAMHQLNTAYTVYFNRKYERAGHLFQGRYRALLVQDNPYLLEVSRYLHLNAFRAHLVDDPFRYKWSSCSFYTGHENAPPWLDTQHILEMLSSDPKEQKRVYIQFIEDGVGKSYNPFDKLYARTILGDEDFFESVKRKLSFKEHHEVPATKEFRSKASYDEIVAAVSRVSKKSVKKIIDGDRFSLERKLVIYLLRTKTDMSLNEIGKHFGITYAAVTQIKKAFHERLKHDTELKKLVEQISGTLES